VRHCLLLGAGLLAVAILVACGGDGDGGESGSSLEQALRRMVLQAEDLPQGFVQRDELFTTNEYQASLSADPEARKAQLENWGRLLGYEVTYQPAGAVAQESPVRGINVSSSLYLTEEGAGAAFFIDAVKGAEERDWAADFAGLRDFQQEEVDVSGVADEIVWLRVSGFQPVDSGPDPLVTDDFIFIRVGRERGFLRVQTSSIESGDRQVMRATVEQWLRALVQNVEEVLAAPGLEVDEE
jgi:hypothetical protein